MNLKKVSCTGCKSFNEEANRCKKTWFYILAYYRKCRYYKPIDKS